MEKELRYLYIIYDMSLASIDGFLLFNLPSKLPMYLVVVIAIVLTHDK